MADRQIFLDEDWHVHSTFSDGSATVTQNVCAAEALGLRSICLVDKVRGTTDWMSEFVESCRAAARGSTVQVHCGVEAKLLDTEGKLDMPASAARADYVFVDDRHLPTPRGPMHPDAARERIDAGELLPAKAVEWLVRGVANAVQRHDRVILAHPFGILPRLGLDEGALHRPFVRWLATVMAKHQAGAEISERWRSPAPWVIECFLAAGVAIHASTDSRSLETLGRYAWCRRVTQEVTPTVTALVPVVAA
jgi:putative hydrolase